MKSISNLIHTNKAALIDTSMETLFTASWGEHLEITEESCARILEGIFSHVEKDLKSERRHEFGHYLSHFYLQTFQRDSKLRRNFHLQLALLGTARVVLNHFLIHHHVNEGEDFNAKLENVQKIFDYALIFLSQWWGQIYRDIWLKDQQLIQELKIVKNGLQKQLNVIYQLIKESPIGVVGCDEELHVLHWNPMASRLTGLEPANILKKRITEVFALKSRDLFLKRVRSERERVPTLHLNILRNDGNSFPALVSISRIRKINPGNIAFIVSFQDISTQAKFDSHIKKIDRLTTISRLTSAMMHDVRNPLNTLGLHSELLANALQREYGSIRPEVNSLLEKMQNQIQYLTTSLNHYLSYTHLTDLNMVPCNLSEQFENMMQDVIYEASVRKIKINHPRLQRDYPVMADWLQLKRVFMNLFHNAFEVLGEDGQVRVKIYRRNSRVLVKITDNGPGIDPNYQNKIFEPFFTTKKSGEGLGLFISREIVNAHGGRISYASQPGRGTSFTVSLPLTKNRDENGNE
ncbi:MAG: ATP-binding protein [Calditrichia bacterium]